MAEREKWEYRQWYQLVPDFQTGAGDDFIETTTRVLNERGEDGWELVTVFPVLFRQDVPSGDGAGVIQHPAMVQYVAQRRIR